MLKFDIIESEEDKNKVNRSNLMKNLTRSCFDFSFSKGVNYIFVEGPEIDFFGGAILIKKELYEIQEDIRLLVTDMPLQGLIWECSQVFHPKALTKKAEEEGALYEFYRGLYEKLVEFGHRKGIGFIIMKLTPEIYCSTIKWGKWPYVVELKPENSHDPLFHGVYEAYQRTWKV